MEKNKQMIEDERERLTDDAELLNQYLNQYKNCIRKKKILEKRRTEIEQEFNSPIHAIRMDGMPKGGNSDVGCAAISLAMDEIDCMLKEQVEISAKILTNIMTVIDFLQKNSLERDIIESRYIDRHYWNLICSEYHISRSHAIRKWRKGLYILLEFEKVKHILKEYKIELHEKQCC